MPLTQPARETNRFDPQEQRNCPLCNSSGIKPYRQLLRNYAGTGYELHLGNCAKCGFVFLLNDPHIEYDKDYLYLEQVTTTDVLAHFRAQERIASIARYVPPAPERRFLDIGIGDGLLLSLAETAGYCTFGLDVNPAGVEIARKQYGLQAKIGIGLPEEAFPNEEFDVIHMNEVIEHISDPMSLLLWCRRHLREKGILAIQTGNLDSLASRIKGADWDYFRPVHVSYFSTWTLSYAVQQAGFRIVRHSTMDWRFIPSLHMIGRLLKHNGIVQALRFLVLYITALPHGIRRTVLIYAT